jgi:hypothetical protein
VAKPGSCHSSANSSSRCSGNLSRLSGIWLT